MSSALVAVVTAAVATKVDNCSRNKCRGNCDDTEKIAYVCGSYDDNGKTQHIHSHSHTYKKTPRKLVKNEMYLHSEKNIKILFRYNIQKMRTCTFCAMCARMCIFFPAYVIWMRKRGERIKCNYYIVARVLKMLVSVAICNSLHVLNAQQHSKSRYYNIFNGVWKRASFTCKS